ncbi:NAD-dependent epimerase/dehydratase family protein [Streptomyces sp. NPDC054766]
MGMETVLVVGGTGFIGTAVVRQLRSRGRGSARPQIRVLSSRTPPETDPADDVRYVRADLTQPETLDGVCTGVTTLLHTASYVGRDPARCEAVNHLGTLALLAEAHRAGVDRIVYVSTTSVYGPGPHRGVRELQQAPAPASPASASRLRAERAVLDAGGLVLRPHLVYGRGDVWVVPTLAGLLARVPGWPAGAMPRSSMVSVDDLARCAVSLACGAKAPTGPDVYHVADPEPVPMDRLLSAMHRVLGLPLPQYGEPAYAHRARTARAMPGLTDHQYALLTRDHWYDCDRVWARTGEHPGPGFEQRFAEYRSWYLRHLTGTGRPSPAGPITGR